MTPGLILNLQILSENVYKCLRKNNIATICEISKQILICQKCAYDHDPRIYTGAPIGFKVSNRK